MEYIVTFIIAGVLWLAFEVGWATYKSSQQADPHDRAKEAAIAAKGSAGNSIGCIMGTIMSLLPIAIIITIIIFVIRSCS